MPPQTPAVRKDDTPTKFRATTPVSTAPAGAGLLEELHQGLQGGDKTWNFFAGKLEGPTALLQTVATGGDSVWIDAEDDDGNPVWYVANGQNFLTLTVQLDKHALQEGSTEYKQVGIHTITFTTDKGTSEQLIGIVEMAGEGIAGTALTPIVFRRLLKPIGRALKNFLSNFFSKTMSTEAETTEEAARLLSESSEEATEESAIVGEEVAEGVVVSVAVAFEVAAVVLSVIVIAVVVILKILAKSIHNLVKVYNVTDLDLELETCYLVPGTAAMTAPAKVGETAKIPKIGFPPHPPHVKPEEKVVYRADLSFLNEDQLAGVGYVLRATPNDHLPHGLTVVVEIPSLGENSIYVSMAEEDGSCETVHKEREGQDHHLTATVTHGDYTLTVATNRTDKEKSPSPITQAEGYNYQHLIVLEKKGV